MLDDPFVLPDNRLPFSLPPSSSSFTLLAATLPPSRPSFGQSHSYKENNNTATVTSSGGTTTSTSGSTSKPRSVRRVYFSSTPLASLKASPKHKRPYAALLVDDQEEDGRVGAKRARKNVYSDAANPMRRMLDEVQPIVASEEVSPASSAATTSTSANGSRDGVSSPPTSSPFPPAAQLLPPLRLSALRVSSVCAPSPPKAPSFAPSQPSATPAAAEDSFAFTFTPPQPLRTIVTRPSSASELVMPFSLPGLKPVALEPVDAPAAMNEEDEATDSENEAEVVSSLLLPSSAAAVPSPTKLSIFALSTSAAVAGSSSSSLASSSPLPSPSSARPPSRRPSSTGGLRSILKPRLHGAPGVGLTALNEREGSRKNGRGRKHCVGWEDCKVPVTALAAAGATSTSGKAPAASTSRGSTRRTGGYEGEKRGDEPEDQRRRAPPPPSSGPGGGGGPSQPQDTQTGGARITYAVQPDDPVLLQTPLLVLQASLRPVSAVYASVAEADEGVLLPALLPRAAPHPAGGEADPAGLFETPTFLPDVEEAYVLLTRALFRLPASLTAADALAHTLAPLVTLKSAFLASVHRDVGNVASFPAWIASQPVPTSPERASSSPASSPVQQRSAATAAEKGKGKAAAKGKKSLTEEQMRRMRDELGAAQAAVKCVAAVMRDQRVWSVFADDELVSLLEVICALPLAPSLSTLVQKDLFPFIPFLLSNLSIPTSLTAPLITSSFLPAIRASLTLGPRVDRYRLAFSESLTALSALLASHPKDVFADGAWRSLFRPAMAGLWDGPKKAMGTREKSLKVAGRIVRALTAPIAGEDAQWAAEREALQKEVAKEMITLLHDSPPDAPINPETRKPSNYITSLLRQLEAPPTSPPNAAQGGEEALKLQNLAVLAVLPVLLGSSFRRLHEKGIRTWLQPYNRIFDSSPSSAHVFAISALSWSHVIYAFLRTVSDKSDTWLFRKPDLRPFVLLLGIFTSRAGSAWRKADSNPGKAGGSAARKEQQRAHAKALALAFVALVYGCTVYIRHGVSSIRAKEDSQDVDAPLAAAQLEEFDHVFEQVQKYLPSMAHTTVSQDAPVLAWQLLSSVVRPRTAADGAATLEALVNPSFLNGSLGQAKPERQELVTAAAMRNAVQPSRIPGWGSGWVESRVEKVLGLFEKCLPGKGEETTGQVVQPHYTVAWQNLLRSLALSSSSSSSASSPLSRALSWLSTYSASGPAGVVAALWSAAVARPEEAIVRAVERVVREKEVLEAATGAWLALPERPQAYAEVFAQAWTAALSSSTTSFTPAKLTKVVELLRLRTDSPGSTDGLASWQALASAVHAAVWTDEPAGHLLSNHLAGFFTPPADAASDLRLCALLASASHDLSAAVQDNVLDLSKHAVGRLLETDAATDEQIKLIAGVLEAASDDAFPTLYEFVLEQLSTAINPTNTALHRYNPLLAPSLHRANELIFAGAAPETQADTQASLQASLVSHSYARHPAHRPYLAFESFWRGSFGRAQEDLTIPEELVDSLAIVRELVPDFPVRNLGETQGMSQVRERERTTGEPVPGQVAPSRQPTLPTTSTTAPNVSSRSYDADHSVLPTSSRRDFSSLEDSFNPLSMRGGVREPSPSLYGIAAPDSASLEKSASSVEQSTNEVEETPAKVEKMRARASMASAASSAAAATAMEVEPVLAKPEVRRSPRTKGKGKEKRPREEEVEVLTIDDSEDEEIVVASSRPQPAPRGSSPPPRKKGRASKKARASSASSASEVAAPEPSTSRAKSSSRKRTTAVVEIEVPAPSKRRRRSPKVKKEDQPAPSPATGDLPTSSPPLASRSTSPELAASASASASSDETATAVADEELVRRFFALPLDTAVQIGRRLGSPSLKRLMDLGERAKEYFERLSQSSSP